LVRFGATGRLAPAMKVPKSPGAGEITHSVAHYLTTIHELHARRGYARISDIARALEFTKGSVSLQMKHLKDRGLVIEDENRFLRLSPAGEAIAHEVIRTRQVLIEFLVKLLGVPEDDARSDACRMEHLLGKETSHRLLALAHILQSDDPAAREFRERLSRYELDCAHPADCKLCSIEEAPAHSADLQGK
jgi:DtxR family transcriptional regulator, Mn-dependent transcriptional regulator